LGNYTPEPLPSYVGAIAALESIWVGEYIGGYNQYFQEVLVPTSGLIKYEPDIVYLALSLRELSPDIYYDFSSLPVGERKGKLNHIISQLSDWVKVTLNNTKASILLSNFIRPDFNSAGIADIHQEYGESEFYFELNLELLRLFRNESRVHIFDIDRLAARFGKGQVHDPKMYYIAKMEWREKFLPVIAGEIIRYIKAIQNVTKKCLVLDLDNTLWGGVVGEDGSLGVKVGHGDPVSEAFLDFQHKIRTIKDRGVILAICSKNNPEDALEVFEKRPEMPLKKSDFSVMEINWNTKDSNIRNIAKTLNIGTDSLVFIDDNPAECSLVSQMVPEVETILLPSDPATYPALLDQVNGFEKLRILEDDLQKTTQYLQNKQREESKSQIGDLKSYLESLGTEITIRQATEDDLPRVHQLFTKTNQFNLTTIRYSVGDVEQFFRSDNYDLTVISAQDRFGELGIIALYLLQLDDNLVKIDSFIMSCRAMGRGVETAIVNQIKSQYLTSKTDITMSASYLPTAKNKPVKSFLEEQGFEVVEEDSTGKKSYTLEAINAQLLDCSWVKVTT
ncbi:MAG: HAD-IIIC family phosphatase, partial [Coleofasciculaceae cyanobacterium]